MELFFFLLVFVIIIAMGAIGLWKGNPWLTYITSIFSMLLGLLLMTEGVITPQVTTFVITSSSVTPAYQVITPDDPLIFILTWLLLGGGLVFLLLTAYYHFKGRAGAAFE